MSVALLGSEGSMGQRYSAVLAHLKEPFVPLDITKNKESEIEKAVKDASRILIATPTKTHVEMLRKYMVLKVPILCEKPVTKDLAEIIELHAWAHKNAYSYNMVMQYKRLDLPFKTPSRWSHYNYFRPGKPEDGLAWNCMQTIALAQGPVWISDKSPAWECTINGRSLSIADMDAAYVEEIRLWLMGALDQSMDEILQMHKKVHDWKEQNEAD